jgi:hypothetical protein
MADPTNPKGIPVFVKGTTPANMMFPNLPQKQPQPQQPQKLIYGSTPSNTRPSNTSTKQTTMTTQEYNTRQFVNREINKINVVQAGHLEKVSQRKEGEIKNVIQQYPEPSYFGGPSAKEMMNPERPYYMTSAGEKITPEQALALQQQNTANISAYKTAFTQQSFPVAPRGYDVVTPTVFESPTPKGFVGPGVPVQGYVFSKSPGQIQQERYAPMQEEFRKIGEAYKISPVLGATAEFGYGATSSIRSMYYAGADIVGGIAGAGSGIQRGGDILKTVINIGAGIKPTDYYAPSLSDLGFQPSSAKIWGSHPVFTGGAVFGESLQFLGGGETSKPFVKFGGEVLGKTLLPGTVKGLPAAGRVGTRVSEFLESPVMGKISSKLFQPYYPGGLGYRAGGGIITTFVEQSPRISGVPLRFIPYAVPISQKVVGVTSFSSDVSFPQIGERTTYKVPSIFGGFPQVTESGGLVYGRAGSMMSPKAIEGLSKNIGVKTSTGFVIGDMYKTVGVSTYERTSKPFGMFGNKINIDRIVTGAEKYTTITLPNSLRSYPIAPFTSGIWDYSGMGKFTFGASKLPRNTDRSIVVSGGGGISQLFAPTRKEIQTWTEAESMLYQPTSKLFPFAGRPFVSGGGITDVGKRLGGFFSTGIKGIQPEEYGTSYKGGEITLTGTSLGELGKQTSGFEFKQITLPRYINEPFSITQPRTGIMSIQDLKQEQVQITNIPTVRQTTVSIPSTPSYPYLYLYPSKMHGRGTRGYDFNISFNQYRFRKAPYAKNPFDVKIPKVKI